MRRLLLCLTLLSPILAVAQTPQVIFTFTGSNGAQPVGSFVQNPDGSMMGATYGGGSGGFGTIYSIQPDGTNYATLYNFTGGLDGGSPNAGPISGPYSGGTSGIYGTAMTGGAHGNGVIWNINSSLSYKVLHSFTDAEGSGPNASLIWGTDGNLWSTTLNSTGGYGTIFKVSPMGTLTTMHNFSAADGQSPAGGLLQASNGNFYGTTQYGGTYGYGTLWELTLDDVYSVLWNFTGGEDGGYPCAGLEEDPDGILWGTTMVGGTEGYGTEFNYNLGNDTLNVTYDFDDSDGDDPDFTDFLGGDGNFYSTTNLGGTAGFGTINEFNPAKPATVNTWSFNGVLGAYPSGGMFEGMDGNMYTTSQYGGSQSDQGFLLKIAYNKPITAPISVGLSETSITLGQSATLTWALATGYSDTRRGCYATGDDTAEWSGTQTPIGTMTVSPTAIGTYTYALVCAGSIVGKNVLQVTNTSKKSSSTSLTVSPNPVVSGAIVKLTATVVGEGGTPTGSVSFVVGGQTLGTAKLNGSGVAIVSTSTAGYPIGSYSVTAVYGGDEEFYGSTSTAVAVTLLKQPTTTSLAIAPTTVNEGKTVTMTSVVDGGSGTQRPTGDVTFTASIKGHSVDLATIPLNSKQTATLTAPANYTGGSYIISAKYSGDASFSSSTSPNVTVTVVGDTETSVTLSPTGTLQPGSVLTQTIAVTGNGPSTPTGEVAIALDGKPVGTLTLKDGSVTTSNPLPTSLAPGLHTISAIYGGDDNNLGSNGSATFNSIGATSTALTVSPSIVKQGNKTTLTATVTKLASTGPTPTGSVTFSLDGMKFGTAALNGSGVATFAATVPEYVAPNTYVVTATYGGDANYAGSSGTSGITVTK